MTEHIFIGIIGYGKHLRRSHFLASLSKERSDMTVIGFFDPSPSSSSFIKEDFDDSVVQFSSLESLLEEKKINTIFIGSPDQFHADQLESCVRAGKHVFVEKPLAANASEMESVETSLKMAKEKGLVVSTCHPRRMDHQFQFIEDKLPVWEDSLGSLMSIDYRFSYPKPGSERDWKHERGLMIDHVSHEIDLVKYLFPNSVNFKADVIRDSPYLYEMFGTCLKTKGDENMISYRFLGRRLNDTEVKRYIEILHLTFEKGEVNLDCESGEIVKEDHGSLDPHLEIVKVGGPDFDRKFTLLTENFLGAVKGECTSYVSIDQILFNARFPFTLNE